MLKITAFLGVLAVASPLAAAVVPVSTSAQLIAAINAAQPGDVITLAAGTYNLAQNLICDTAGTAAAPIVVRAEALGTAFLRFNAVEGFKVSAPHWRFENLDVQGVCASHSSCEHAFHIVGGADFTHIRRCRLHDYNAAIKGNGEGDPYVFPDDVVIENSEFFNATVRNTSNPCTPIDIVGGRRWVVRSNFIHDHAKGQGDTVSYAAFLKGGSRDGLIERNLVVCELLHAGGIRLGLSFGGGGTGPDSICEDGSCTPEHQGGVMRNNLIRNCPEDVGIYLNEAANVGIHHNLLYQTTGIDVRFVASNADLRNNVLGDQIRNRDGGVSTEAGNLENVSPAQFEAWFADPANGDFAIESGASLVNLGAAGAGVPNDFCARPRQDGLPDLGPLEEGSPWPCDTTVAGGGADLFQDGFESGGLGGWGLVVP